MGRRELQLDIVRITERQDVQAKDVAKIRDLAVGDPPLVEQLPCSLELIATRHTEAEMVESDASLVEPVVVGSATGIGARTQPQPDGAIAEENAGGEIHHKLEPDDLGVKRPAALNVRDGQAEMVNGAGSNRRRHDEDPPGNGTIASVSGYFAIMRAPFISHGELQEIADLHQAEDEANWRGHRVSALVVKELGT
jgi:hypothetical protein